MSTTTKHESPTAVERLDVIAACPKCGGENAWQLLQTLTSCEFCGSALWWPRDPDRPRFLVAEDAAERPEDLLDVLRTLDAIRERSRIAGIGADLARANGKIPIDRSDDPTLPSVNELKEQRRHLLSLDAHHKVLAPYVLVSATLAFHVLGRPRGGVKEFRNLFFRLEEIVPGYPPPWNFRDRGLWVAKQRLRPFMPEDFTHRTVARVDDVAQLERLTSKWRSQPLLIQPELEPITFDSSLLQPSECWVYRPFHFVRARTPMRNGWSLVDGQFATVAGYPEEEEIRRVIAPGWTPLDTREISAAAPRAIGCRCPECGADVPLVERIDLLLCENCGRLLEPSPNGFTVRPYAIVDRESIPWWPDSEAAEVAWLPFFRVDMSATPGGARVPCFASLLREALPAAGPHASQPPTEWPETWIPAFEGLTVGRYDAWAFEWAAALTRIRPKRCERRFFTEEPVEKSNRIIPCAIEWEAIRPLFPRLLLELLPKPVQARLNPVVLKKLSAATFDVGEIGLVFVPAPITQDGERRVLGPSSSVAWTPLRDGKWPPDLQRDVRRAMERGKRMEQPRAIGGILSARIEKR